MAAIEEVVQNNTKDRATIESLQKILKNSESPIRLQEHAAWALGQLDQRDSVNLLVNAAKHKSLLVRSAGLNALMRMRAQTGLPVYIEIAKNDPILILRQRATLALGLLRWEKTIDTLVELSSSDREEVRGAAVLAMGATHSKKNDFSEIISEMQKDESAYVQKRALRALRIIERKNATIQTHLEDSDPDIRLMAALYFHHFGNKSDLTAIKNQLEKEQDGDVSYELNLGLIGIQKRVKAEEEKKRKEEAAKKKSASPPTAAN